MRPNRAIVAAVSLATIVAALTAGTALQARFIPSARNDWRLLCSDGRVVEHFLGSYGEAIKGSGCAPARVVNAWDNGLYAHGQTPWFRGEPNTQLQAAPVAVEPGTGGSYGPATGVSVGIATSSATLRPPIRDLRQSELKSYDVKGFDCAGAGAGAGARDAAGSATRAPARTCQFGATGPEPERK